MGFFGKASMSTWNFFFGTSSYSALAKKTACVFDLNTTYFGVDVRKNDGAEVLANDQEIEPHIRMFRSLATMHATWLFGRGKNQVACNLILWKESSCMQLDSLAS
jgi:hypothetical protein